MIRLIDRAGMAATLLLPLFLLHGRGIAEGLIALLCVLFLLRSALTRDVRWLATPWLVVALVWWGWLVLCSAIHGGFGQSLGTVRFLVLAAALEHWALRDPAVRRWLLRLVQVASAYIAAQTLWQLGTGRNLFGYPRGDDGELTGPYQNPRAAPPFVRLLFPSILPVVAALLTRPGWGALCGALLLLAPIGLLVAMGQRMPLLLGFLGLFVTALLLPRLRGPVLVAALLASGLLGASRFVLPEAHHRLVQRFGDQMASFPDSHYGQIAARAMAIVAASPVTGAGFDGFRRDCANPGYFAGWGGGDGGGAGICVQHPHNPYLQAAVEAGAPGLLLFAATAIAWLAALGRGLMRDANALRAGLFVAALLHLWPIASTNAWTSMPVGGWFFLLLGLGLAESRNYITPQPSGAAA